MCSCCCRKPTFKQSVLKFTDMKLDYLDKKSVGQGSGDINKDRFHKPLSLVEIENLSHRSFAQNTENKIAWATQLYRNWWFQRCAKVNCDTRIKWSSIDNLKQISKTNFCFALCAFISEIKKKDRSEFPGSSLYQILICIQFFVEKNGLKLKLLDHPDFVPLRFTLDNLMKERSRAGLGRKKSADVISVEDEEKMWADGVLGDESPEQLRQLCIYWVSILLCAVEMSTASCALQGLILSLKLSRTEKERNSSGTLRTLSLRQIKVGCAEKCLSRKF